MILKYHGIGNEFLNMCIRHTRLREVGFGKILRPKIPTMKTLEQ